MTKVRVLVTTMVVLGLALVSLPAAVAQTGSGAKPKATEIGITATEIHVAVPADVDNPFQPGLFQVPGSTATRLIWRPPAIG